MKYIEQVFSISRFFSRTGFEQVLHFDSRFSTGNRFFKKSIAGFSTGKYTEQIFQQGKLLLSRFLIFNRTGFSAGKLF